MLTIRRSFGRTLLRSSALGVSLALVASAVPAFAQDAPQADEAVDGDEIIVTATRRSEALSDVPIAVSAVTGETLAKTGRPSRAEVTDAIDAGVWPAR